MNEESMKNREFIIKSLLSHRDGLSPGDLIRATTRNIFAPTVEQIRAEMLQMLVEGVLELSDIGLVRIAISVVDGLEARKNRLSVYVSKIANDKLPARFVGEDPNLYISRMMSILVDRKLEAQSIMGYKEDLS